MDDDEEGAFSPEEVNSVINKACDPSLSPSCLRYKVLNNCLSQQQFVHSKVSQWVYTIVENCLKELAVMNDDPGKNGERPKMKYIVNCTLQQKTGAGLQTACMCYWDKATDGYTSVKWEGDQIQALCTVFGVMV